MTLLENAKNLLFQNSELTCVICCDQRVYKSTQRGVRPLIEFLDSGENLKGASAADKVVGKGAAFLYVLLGVKEVYAHVMSESARTVLLQNGVTAVCDRLVPAIKNRKGDGFCPIETAVCEITSPQQAFKAICETLKNLK